MRVHSQPNANYNGTLASARLRSAPGTRPAVATARSPNTQQRVIDGLLDGDRHGIARRQSVNAVPRSRAPVAASGAVTRSEHDDAVGTVSAVVSMAELSLTASRARRIRRRSASHGTGVLSFAIAPNYENPTDAGRDNIYDVIVQVSDGNGGADTQAIAVTVTDVDEFDVGAISDLNAAANAVNENTGNGTTVGITASPVMRMGLRTPTTIRWTTTPADGRGPRHDGRSDGQCGARLRDQHQPLGHLPAITRTFVATQSGDCTSRLVRSCYSASRRTSELVARMVTKWLVLVSSSSAALTVTTPVVPWIANRPPALSSSE